MFGPIPLAPKRLLGVDCKYRQEDIASCLVALCEGVCGESFVWLSEVTQLYKNIVSLLGAGIAQSVQRLATGWTVRIESLWGLRPTQPPIQ